MENMLNREERNWLIYALSMEDLPVHRLMALLDDELIELAEKYGHDIEELLAEAV